MSNPQVALLTEMYRVSMKATLAAVEKVPEAGKMKQLKEGKAHPLWLIGHLANTIEVVGNHWGLGQNYQLPRSYGRDFAPDFAGGKPITDQVSDYAPWDEACAKYAEASDRYLAKLAEVADEELAAKPRNPVREGLESRFPTIGSIAQMMVFHDTHHRAQLIMIAKLAE